MNDKKINRHELPEVLTPNHIQEILGIGRRATYEFLQNPPFHVVRVGRLFKISKKSFFKWLDGE
ncbi:DNA-binding protein [Bacillus sp. JJ1503]|uniref:DNA-binding protein n=1 Tax=Bacillus sp. JJ1503 TaxID=3122956 RepID=UPI0030004D38